MKALSVPVTSTWEIMTSNVRPGAGGGHGWLNLQESLMQSCNVAMMRIGAMIGRERFTKYQGIFGFWRQDGD